ncbi:MAG: lipase family protein [Alphaproteobacteria bacterium]
MLRVSGRLSISLLALLGSVSAFADVKHDDDSSLTGEGFCHVPKKQPYFGTDATPSLILDLEAFSPASVKIQVGKPLVTKTDAGFEIDESFLSNAKVYAEMEQLSYELAKGCNASSSNLLEKYQKLGWKISGFSGVSGAVDSGNTDLPGIVAFHPQTGEAVVAFHGSQDGYDWHNNLDGQLLFAREIKDSAGKPFLFGGRASKGYVERYLSSRNSLYALLEGFKKQSPENFHMTVVGHSLGGAMGELAVADLATYFAKSIWGQDYHNAESNRVRAYLMSGALVFDDEASKQAENLVGRHNVIQDAVASDPVYYMSGKSTADYLSQSYRYGPTALGLKLLQWFGFTKVAHPQLVNFLYGKGRHIGYEALQTASEVQKMARGFVDEAVQKVLSKKWFWGRWLASLAGETFAPIHYGSNQIQQNGSGKLTKAFDPRYIVPETLAERIGKVESQQAKIASSPPPVVEEKQAWYQRWWPF